MRSRSPWPDLRALPLLLLLAGCGGDDEETPVPTVSVSGNAFAFTNSGGDVAGGEVSILELPDRLATTDEDGAFRFDDLPGDADVTFVLAHPDYVPIQTATHTLAGEDLEQMTFQVPTPGLYDVLAASVRLEPDDARCQIATTVTRLGNSLYDDTRGTHGEPGATVTIDPPLPETHGPIYFNLVKYNVIYPDLMLTETTDDGGALFLNVPPGDYTLRAHKADTEFREARMRCRAGMLVNASPPWGLQAVAGGVGPRTEPNWQ